MELLKQRQNSICAIAVGVLCFFGAEVKAGSNLRSGNKYFIARQKGLLQIGVWAASKDVNKYDAINGAEGNHALEAIVGLGKCF